MVTNNSIFTDVGESFTTFTNFLKETASVNADPDEHKVTVIHTGPATAL